MDWKVIPIRPIIKYMSHSAPNEKLWTSSFISACFSNFLLFFAFYLLLPVLPLYLIEEFDASKTTAGVVLSAYTLAALLARPIAAFVLDMYKRKPLFILAFFLFIACFVGYPFANSIFLFLVLRIFHGIAFGFITTASNSFIIDIMPSTRRGEGLGYFGVSNTLAMALGPMISLMMHETSTFQTIFLIAIITGSVGFLLALTIKAANKNEAGKQQEISLDRFLLVPGLHAGFCLGLMGISFGMVSTFVAIYGKELGIKSGIGIFFTLMSVGMIASRLVAGKMVDRGKISNVISSGLLFCCISIAFLGALVHINHVLQMLTLPVFYLIAMFMGWGYGLLFPAFNTLFVNLAPNNRRATASSTYMTSWDIGIGIGLIAGGWLADAKGGLPLAYLVGAMAVAFSLGFFVKIAGPHFVKNKLR